jgi:hypothetical protein
MVHLLALLLLVFGTHAAAHAAGPPPLGSLSARGAPVSSPECGDGAAGRRHTIDEIEQTCDAVDRPPARPGRLAGHDASKRQGRSRERTTRRTSLSVVIPTRDRPALLRRALGSFAHADPSLEIIVVDDGSIAVNAVANRSACERLPGCRYIALSSSRGASAARNHGLRLSQGAYVWFLDDDDYATGRTVADVLQAVTARTEPEILLMPRNTLLGGTLIGQTIPADERDKRERYRRIGIEVTSSCALFPRSVLTELNGWDEDLTALQDTDLLLRAAEFATFASLRTEPVMVDTSSPDRISYTVFASLLGKARFLRKHWHRLPLGRRLGYIAQILCCMPLIRALRLRWQLAIIRKARQPSLRTE